MLTIAKEKTMNASAIQIPVRLLFAGQRAMTVEDAASAAQEEVAGVVADGRWHWQSDHASPDVFSLRGQPEAFRRVLDDCHAWRRRVFINDVAGKAEKIAAGLPHNSRDPLLRAAAGLRCAKAESGAAAENLKICLGEVLQLSAARIADAIYTADESQVSSGLREIEMLFAALSDNTHRSDFCDLRFDNPEDDIITAIPTYMQVAEDAARYCGKNNDYYLATIIAERT